MSTSASTSSHSPAPRSPRSRSKLEQLLAVVEAAERAGSNGGKHGWKPIRRYIREEARPHSEALYAALLEECTKATPNRHRMYKLQQRYANALSTRLVALEAAYRQVPKKHQRLRASELIRRAMNLNIHQPSRETVRVYLVPKSSGGFRQVAKPGLEHRARQMITYKLLEPFSRPLPQQFSARGVGGRNAAARLVVEALNQGYVFAAHADIRNAFPSCTPDHVRRLLGPFIHRGVIDHDLMAERMNTRVVPPNDDEAGRSEELGPADSIIHACLAHMDACRQQADMDMVYQDRHVPVAQQSHYDDGDIFVVADPQSHFPIVDDISVSMDMPTEDQEACPDRKQSSLAFPKASRPPHRCSI